MLLLTLIAILSIAIVEGLDPYKGLLFSYYFYSFGKVKESYIVPIVSTTVYYIIGIIISALFSDGVDSLFERAIVFILLINYGIMKISMGKILHYTGNTKPKMLNVVKWSLVNSLIEMSPIVILALSILSKQGIVILLVVVLTFKELTFLLSTKNYRIILGLTKYNFDYFNLLTLPLLCTLVILPLL